MCRLFIHSIPNDSGVSFDELYSVALESLFYSMKGYDEDKNITFYTYSMNTIQKELMRYFVKCMEYYSKSNISLDSISKDEGLLYDELIGNEDEKIKQIFINSEINETINEGEFDIDEFKKKDVDERIYILMLELTGQYTLSKDEIKKLKRRIKYYLSKKEKEFY